MRFDVEVISEEVLPAIRSIIASKLHSDYGMTQEEIASQLEVTQPAVSQYLSGARSSDEVVNKLKKDTQVALILDSAASAAAQGDDFIEDIGHAVDTVRDKGLLKEKFERTERL